MKALKKLRIHIAIFLITGILAVLVLFDKTGTDTLKMGQVKVALEDTLNIDHFLLELPDGNDVVLSHSLKGTWMVNDKYPAREQLIKLLIFGLNKLEVKRPVSDKLQEKIYHKIKASGVKASIYQSGKVNTFYVLPDDNDVNSSYLLKDGTRAPLIVYVPGIKGEISAILNLKEEDWRSRDLFSSSTRSIQKISISYPDRSDDSFEINYKNNAFNVSGIPQADSTRLARYIEAYGFVNVDKYLVQEKDSLLSVLASTKPFATIELSDIIESKSKIIDIYRNMGQTDYFYGIIRKEKEVVLLNPDIFKYLLVKKSYFSAL